MKNAIFWDVASCGFIIIIIIIIIIKANLATYQKVGFFIVAAVKTSNPT
jgi:hypothetical protein